MADWMKMWKSVSSRQLADALDIAPPIWQPDYFDRYLRSQEIMGKNGITWSKMPRGPG